SEPVAVPPPAPAAAPAPTPMPTAAPEPAPEQTPVPAPQVTIAGMKFTPATLTVPAGTRVVWTNDDTRDHTVRFADQESWRIPPGETYSRSFDVPGEYPCECGIHPSMRGVIVVQ
ncbi:MAG: cupredoxin domain-containing protein, partial [Gammaproteobacteria bacterium]